MKYSVNGRHVWVSERQRVYVCKRLESAAAETSESAVRVPAIRNDLMAWTSYSTTPEAISSGSTRKFWPLLNEPEIMRWK